MHDSAEPPRAYAMSDIHGRLDAAVELLRAKDLIDSERRWRGGHASLWFLGDYVDRGPEGIGVIEFIMQLQDSAKASGGRVGTLLGNHDIFFLAAHRFGDTVRDRAGRTFRSVWQRNGGNVADLNRLETKHIRWLESLVPMAVERAHLLIHADSDFYRQYGRNVAAVNRKIQKIIRGADPEEWMPLIRAFTRRQEFESSSPDGMARAAAFLIAYQCRRLVHGHTPICFAEGGGSLEEARVYADGLCVNIDGGLFLGGPGIVYEICAL